MITKEHKIKEIVSSDISKRQIDPKGKGSAVLKLQRGEHVSDKKIEEMYENIQCLKKDEQPTVKFENTISNKSHEEIEQLKNENEQLKQKIKELKYALGSVTKPILGSVTKPEKVNGFTICLKKVGAKGKRYKRRYATKRINGKQIWIYIGSANPAEKIEEWFKKKGLKKI